MGRIQKELGLGPWIVRSSSLREDGAGQSNAGALLSILDVRESDLETSIERVIDSYDGAVSEDEILVQPMLDNVVRSGVVFPHDPNSESPYRIVNWTEGRDTTSVTGGGRGSRVWQQAACSAKTPPGHLRPIIRLLHELLSLSAYPALEFEFAVTEDNLNEEVWLLQTRPLVLRQLLESEEAQGIRLQYISNNIERGMEAQPVLIGRTTMYGVMPDWNPAEIIGVKPKPLALSLYRDLVTDSTWAYQHHNYGYRNLRSFPLMSHFFGLPYIDVRLSFNSFIPFDLDDRLAGRLVDHYMNRLLEEPSLYDKVEFEIVFSCHSLDLPDRLCELLDVGFTQRELLDIASSLRRLTNRIIHVRDGLWRSDAAKSRC